MIKLTKLISWLEKPNNLLLVAIVFLIIFELASVIVAGVLASR